MSQPSEEGDNRWNAASYDDAHAFVYEYGEDVVDLLDPRSEERILDLGCGTGHLTQQIADTGATVVGIDNAADMIAEAQATHPDPKFVQADAREFDASALDADHPFDAVFSNAALHWITDQDAVLKSVTDALRPGGRFVAELGGSGNVEAIVAATHAELDARGYEMPMPWYFPTIGEYASRLEDHGFEVRHARLFDRPTELDDGEAGLAAWLDMFGDSLLAPLDADEQAAVVTGVEDRLRDEQFSGGSWIADYRRLRIAAVLTDA